MPKCTRKVAQISGLKRLADLIAGVKFVDGVADFEKTKADQT